MTDSSKACRTGVTNVIREKSNAPAAVPVETVYVTPENVNSVKMVEGDTRKRKLLLCGQGHETDMLGKICARTRSSAQDLPRPRATRKLGRWLVMSIACLALMVANSWSGPAQSTDTVPDDTSGTIDDQTRPTNVLTGHLAEISPCQFIPCSW